MSQPNTFTFTFGAKPDKVENPIAKWFTNVSVPTAKPFGSGEKSAFKGYSFGHSQTPVQPSVNFFSGCFGPSQTPMQSSVNPFSNFSFGSCNPTNTTPKFNIGKSVKKETSKKRKSDKYDEIEYKYIKKAYTKFKDAEKELLNELYQFNIDNPEKAVKLSEGGKIAYKEYIGKFKKQKH
jgi:hypothetical protein